MTPRGLTAAFRARLRDWPIRRKMAVLALMPTLVAVAVGTTAATGIALIGRTLLIDDVRTQARIVSATTTASSARNT